MLEYALASGLIALAGVAAMPAYGSTINILFGKVSEIVLNSIH
jgi:Flp pilus assembly pilin Flp